MTDPFNSMQGFIGQFQGFMQNPLQYMMQRRMNLPQGWMQNPQAAVQQLMNSGQMSQSQFNQLQQMARSIQANPQFQQYMQGGGQAQEQATAQKSQQNG